MPRWKVSPFWWKTLLTVHIAFSVGLLGDSAGFLAVAIRGATETDPAAAAGAARRAPSRRAP